jgi:hypothetical protein
MSHRQLLMATAILASLGMTACSDTTGPKQSPPDLSESSRRGTLRVTKECSHYFFLAGDYCTITSSNLKEIPKGSRITYLSAASPEYYLETDVVLDPRGRGHQVAYGHCSVDLTKIDGTKGCVFSGGTGKFKRFHAEVKLSVLDPKDPKSDLVWNGTYSFGRDRD